MIGPKKKLWGVWFDNNKKRGWCVDYEAADFNPDYVAPLSFSMATEKLKSSFDWAKNHATIIKWDLKRR